MIGFKYYFSLNRQLKYHNLTNLRKFSERERERERERDIYIYIYIHIYKVLTCLKTKVINLTIIPLNKNYSQQQEIQSCTNDKFAL